MGGGGREAKINAIINQRPLRPTHGWVQMKVTERIKQFAVVLANEHRANFAIWRAPARFSVVKGPIRSKVCAPNRLAISHCLTAPHSSNHVQRLADVALQHPWVKNAIWTTFFTKAKGTLPTGKGHFLCFLKTWRGGGLPRPPFPTPLDTSCPLKNNGILFHKQKF